MRGTGMGQHVKSTGTHEATVFSPLSSQSESVHMFEVLKKHVLGKKCWKVEIFATNIRFPYRC